MYRIGLAGLCSLLLLACGGEEKTMTDPESSDAKTGMPFSSRFASASVPYQLTDTSLLNNRDTASLPADYLSPLVPDSTRQKLFGKTTSIKYTPIAKLAEDGKDSYYVVRGTAGSRKAALLLVYDKDGSFRAAAPFLIPDDKAATAQTSLIDKSYVITKTITQRGDGVVSGGEGREVVAYDPAEKRFTLIMTDMLNDHAAVLVNPLDTFAKTNRLAGDYYLNKNNLVAVRDGRYANQILVYIHTRNSGGDCRGELKGEFILTSSNTAVYRQGGDPCILGLTFKGNAVTLNEESGCGNYRGLDCPFEGTFTRKKEEKAKETTNKTRQSKRAQ